MGDERRALLGVAVPGGARRVLETLPHRGGDGSEATLGQLGAKHFGKAVICEVSDHSLPRDRLGATECGIEEASLRLGLTFGGECLHDLGHIVVYGARVDA